MANPHSLFNLGQLTYELITKIEQACNEYQKQQQPSGLGKSRVTKALEYLDILKFKLSEIKKYPAMKAEIEKNCRLGALGLLTAILNSSSKELHKQIIYRITNKVSLADVKKPITAEEFKWLGSLNIDPGKTPKEMQSNGITDAELTKLLKDKFSSEPAYKVIVKTLEDTEIKNVGSFTQDDALSRLANNLKHIIYNQLIYTIDINDLPRRVGENPTKAGSVFSILINAIYNVSQNPNNVIVPKELDISVTQLRNLAKKWKNFITPLNSIWFQLNQKKPSLTDINLAAKAWENHLLDSSRKELWKEKLQQGNHEVLFSTVAKKQEAIPQAQASSSVLKGK